MRPCSVCHGSSGVGSTDQGLHFGGSQPCNRLRRRLLRLNGSDMAAPLDMSRVTTANEAGEGANGGQALIAGLHRATAAILKMGEEVEQAPGGKDPDGN